MDSRIAFHISHAICHVISRVIVSRIRPWDRILEMCDNYRMRKYHFVFFKKLELKRDSKSFSHARSRVIISRIRSLGLFSCHPMGCHGMARRHKYVRVPSHVSGMRCVLARSNESERDALILLSLSLTWFCAKTQRIPDTWD